MKRFYSRSHGGVRVLAGAPSLLAALLATTAVSAQPAQSQVSATASPQTQGATTVGELVVQATKRNQRLENVPEAVAVVTGQELTSVGPINNTQDVLNLVPGARFNNLADPLNSEISVRGSGTERATGADSSVGLYFDNVYVGANQLGGRNLAPIDSFDLNHMEVLEGPQGALYGRDAEYGVVNMLPQEPTFSNSGLVDDTYNFETQQNIVTGIVNYKINDHWALRVGAEDYTQSSGFEYNPDNQTYYDQTKGYIVRGQLRYQNENLDVDLLAEQQHLQVPSFWSAYDIAPRNTVTGYPGIATVPFGFSQNARDIAHNGIDYSEEDVSNVILSINDDLGWAKLSSTSSWRSLYTIAEVDNDYSDLAQEINTQTECKTLGVALKNCGSYPFGQGDNTDATESWYEDLHLDGAPILGGRVTWLAGLELLDQPTHGYGTQTQNPCPATTPVKLPSGATLNVPAGMVVGDGVCVGTPTGIQQVAILPGSVYPAVTQPSGYWSPYTGNYFSWAPYASLTFNLGAGFKLDGDVRYSHDHKTATEDVYELYVTPLTAYPQATSGQPIPETHYLLDSGNVTYAVTLSWKIPFMPWNDMIYAKTGTGYRVGGFNLGHTPPEIPNCSSATDRSGCPSNVSPPVYYAPVTPTYGDETSDSWELGFKGDITSHAYFALDGYYETTADALAAVGDGCGTRLFALALSSCISGNTNYTVNAGNVDGWGVEAQLDTAWDVAGGHLALNVEGSTQKAWYASEPAGIPGLPLVGTPVAENPAWVASVLFDYRHPITDQISGFFNLVYHGQWGGIQDPETTPNVFFPLSDFQLVNLKTGVDFKKVEVALIVTNLTNDVYKMAQFYQAGVNTVTGAYVPVYSQERLSLPRTFSVEATYRW